MAYCLTLCGLGLKMDALNKCGNGLVEALNTNVYGNGTQTLVLSHGYGLDQTVWHLLIPYFAIYFKVVVFDLVFAASVNPKLYDPHRYSNFGAYARDVTCILDQLHLDKTIFVGHSMSAMIGCIAATRRPELFQHLILLNGSPRYLNAKDYQGGFERPELNAIFGAIEHNFLGWVKVFAPQAVGVNDTAAVTEFESTLGRMDASIALSSAETVFLSDNRNVLQQVQVPTTIIQAEKDITVPKSVPFYMKKKLGRHCRSVHMLKTQGHFPQLTDHLLLWHVLKQVIDFGE